MWELLATIGGSALNAIGGIFGSHAQAQATDNATQAAQQMAQKNLNSQEFWNTKNFEQQERWNQNNLLYQIENRDWTRAHALEEQAYERKFAQETRNREDTAVQRRAADMKAAGINPLLAAGSPASSGAVTRSMAPDAGAIPQGRAPQGTAPQYDNSGVLAAQLAGAKAKGDIWRAYGDAPAQILQLLSARAQLDKTNSETELNHANAKAIAEKLPGEVQLLGVTAEEKKQAILTAQSVVGLNTANVAKIKADTDSIVQAIERDNKLATADINFKKIEANVRQIVATSQIKVGDAEAAVKALAATQLALEIEQKKATIGAETANKYLDLLNKVDGVKLIAAKLGYPELFSGVTRRVENALR